MPNDCFLGRPMAEPLLPLNDECVRCGLSLRRAMVFALAQDGGATTSVNPLQCYRADGMLADHDFQKRTPLPREIT